MAIIYLPKNDFSLNNFSIYPHLVSGSVSVDDYEKHVQPIFNSLSGFYYTKGPQLRGLFGLPKMNFRIDGVSISETLNYALKVSNSLNVPIQDSHSFVIESTKFKELNSDDEWRIDEAICVEVYEKQKGLLKLSRIGNAEKRELNLEEITNHENYGVFRRISDEAIYRTFG